ncbi:MAG TPA: tetratricopeptide repeat protein [Candidatus Angelobacter sp.]|nr:tetratricopeptide repeat protein [Candidatus Angelobacter sp.]
MKRNLILTALAVFCAMAGAIPASAQLVQVAGKVTDKGKPQPGLQVLYKSENTGRTFKLKTNNKGEFFQMGVPIDTYTVSVVDKDGKEVFKQPGVRVNVGGDNVLNTMNIDLTNGATASTPGVSGTGAPGSRTAEFHGDDSNGGSESGKQQRNQPKMSKEEIAAIEAQNAKAKNENVLIAQAQTDLNAKNWQGAIPPLQQLAQVEPNRWSFNQALGNAQLNTGQYDAAVQSFDKGIQVAQNVVSGSLKDPKNPDANPAKAKAALAQMLTNQGNAYLKLNKNQEAVAAYEKAASLDPNPGVAYFNICATQYNTGNTEGALAACNKAIAADPNKADAYFIKGSLLMAQGKTDKSGKYTAPDGTAEALNKYLELEPNGAHANDVKQMLQFIGSKVQENYKAKKK